MQKRLVALAQKLDLIEQNQCDFFIQRIRIVLNQLKKRRQQNCCWPVLLSFARLRAPNYSKVIGRSKAVHETVALSFATVISHMWVL